jgi:hypothetical protein
VGEGANGGKSKIKSQISKTQIKDKKIIFFLSLPSALLKTGICEGGMMIERKRCGYLEIEKRAVKTPFFR